MEVVKKLRKTDPECNFCGAGGICSKNPVMVNAIVNGKPALLNTCLPSGESIEVKGSAAKRYENHWGEVTDVII